jgi:hypothetical protein
MAGAARTNASKWHSVEGGNRPSEVHAREHEGPVVNAYPATPGRRQVHRAASPLQGGSNVPRPISLVPAVRGRQRDKLRGGATFQSAVAANLPAMSDEGQAPPEREWSQGDVLLLDHLERRRAGYGDGMWQAPALTIAGQAFLLQVITNSDVDCVARLAVLLAGLVALLSAVLSLFRVRKREKEYSERITAMFAAKGVRSPTPPQRARWPVV